MQFIIFLNFGYGPIKIGLSASKILLLRKFIELIAAKIPIYTAGTKVNAAFSL